MSVMFFLKRIVFFVLLLMFGRYKRRKLVNRLTSRSKRQKFVKDIETLPAALDDIVELPIDWRDKIQFSAFDKNGLCVNLSVDRNEHGCQRATLDLDIPTYGRFRYNEINRHARKIETDEEDLCSGIKLKLYCQKPMQQWKIYLRGTLIHLNDSKNALHATVSLYWTCLFDPYDYFASPSAWTRAKYLSCLSWKDMLNFLYYDDYVAFEQLGELRGKIVVENHEELSIRLHCVRERSFKQKDLTEFEKIASEIIIVEDTGFSISSSFIKEKDNCIRCFGYIGFPVGDTVPIANYICENEDTSETKTLPSTYSIKACGMFYKIMNKFERYCFSQTSKQFAFISGEVNNKRSFGVTKRLKRKAGDQNTEAELKYNFNKAANEVDSRIKVISLDHEKCQQRLLVGGKAFNLSMLKQFDRFNVPNGFCVTANAFKEHVNENRELQQNINNIIECLRGTELTNRLQEACNVAVKCFQRIPIKNNLLREIRKMFDDIYGENKWEHRKFAVRSSSECEDGTQLSAAGQMDTFLSVKTFEKVLEAVRNCWASSVSYNVVEYRRQNGQSLVENLAVVVQEMVEADKAGVLFTNDPVTGKESLMVINASYGLGEAVVSGIVCPDTILITYDNANELSIKKQEVGDKAFRVVTDDKEGKTLEPVAITDRNRICLTREEILLICEKGIEIERIAGSAQDIEWAISEGRLYILQTRAITTLETETDDEILHEFDKPVINNDLLITTANVQEILPDAVSTLTGDIFVDVLNNGIKHLVGSKVFPQYPVHAVRPIFTVAGAPVLCATIFGLFVVISLGENAKSDFEVGLMGQSVDQHTIKSIKEFYDRPFPSSFRRALRFLTRLLISKRGDSKRFNALRDKAVTFSIGDNARSAETLYTAINENMSNWFDAIHLGIRKSAESEKWSQITMAILKRHNKENNGNIETVMVDMAHILSECKNVCSAEIPEALNMLAKLIAESHKIQQFLEMPDNACDEFLRHLDGTKIKERYTHFLKRHGHRCINEGELYAKSWNQDPLPLIKTLKRIIMTDKFQERTQEKTIDEIVDGLRTPLSWLTKVLLRKYLVKKAIEGVCERELGKATMIKIGDAFKKAYWRLAAMMVREGRLPDERLLFFLTHHEIGKLIDKRSVRLIRLAKHRLKLWPKMKKIKYSKLNFGLPVAIKESNLESPGPVFSLKGMPVCLGRIGGRARVVRNVENANEIEEGDILVCRATDVGWSPYFCLIRGLVTELGGLISHGAVIARECGIPCIVNVPNATDLIKTGDRVILDGNSGMLNKLE